VQLADRVNRISISPTAAVLAAAERYRAQGADLADFGPGEPDFPTPENIVNAAIRALHEGRTKYTPLSASGTRRSLVRLTRCRNAS
jgi:aspartate aminotransferase